MSHLVQSHWLWLYGALSLGIVAGWITYFVAAPRWTDRTLPIALGALAIVILLVLARIAPARHGDQLAFGVLLAIVGVIGGLIGRGLRDLSEFAPAPRSGTAASGGSYLFRDAYAGLGANAPYMRATTGGGGPSQGRVTPRVDATASAPAPRGYTFPETLPFADATRRPTEAARGTGLRRHWSWPA